MTDTTYSSISPDPAVRFGATAQDWLDRWDAGNIVWSIEMGGLGPAYEQCIQITAAEILRDLIEHKPDTEAWKADQQKWLDYRDAMDKRVCGSPVVDKLGLSGAQWGAALSLATGLYMRMPVVALSDPAYRDRLIQVKRDFP
jgi:hypothetical protein